MNMLLSYLATLLILLALPAWFIVSLWRARESDRLLWLLKAIYTGAFLAYLLEVGRWDVVSVYLRFAIVTAFLAALVRSYRRMAGLPWIASKVSGPQRGWSYAAALALAAFFCGSLAWALSARQYEGRAVALAFPLRHGEFYVSHGGDVSLMNHHTDNQAQRYALDIHELNVAGARARVPLPKKLSQYVIFGETVVSPCAGTIRAAVDRFADQSPGETDRQPIAGNHVVIACQGVLVMLAHLRSGSVRVDEGAVVAAGAVIGEVGNTGNTSEPHLHFHAVRDGSGNALRGKGVPVTFDGAFPVRNSIL